MKKFLTLIVYSVIVMASGQIMYAQSHFEPVFGNNSPPGFMNINILEAKLNMLNLEAGNEIGIFDGNSCVGVATLTEDLGELYDEFIFAAIAGLNDPETPEKDGFINGNPISFKFWDALNRTEINPVIPLFIDVSTGEFIPAQNFQVDNSVFIALESEFTPFNVIISSEDAFCYGYQGYYELEIASGGIPFEGGTYDIWVNDIYKGRVASFDENTEAGIYDVVIADSQGSKCFRTVEISQPDPFIFETGQTMANCSLDSGRIWIDQETISGGTPNADPDNIPYDIWIVSRNPSFGEGSITPGFDSYTDTLTTINDTTGFLPPGEYFVRLFDEAGCYSDYSTPGGRNSVTIGTLSLGYGEDYPQCHGQPTDVSVEISFDIEYHQISYSADSGFTWQQSSVFEDLIAGNSYWFGYRNETIDCTYFIQKEIISSPEIRAEEISVKPVTCFGGTDGQVVISTLSGGAGNDWNIKLEGYTFDSEPVEYWYQFSQDSGIILDNLPASLNDYLIYVYDTEGCYPDSIYVKVEQPRPITYDLQIFYSSGDSCSDGRILIETIEGGNPFEQGLYSIWYEGVFQGEVMEFNTGYNLFAGEYEVMVADSNSCTSEVIAEVGVHVIPVSLTCPNDTTIDECHTQTETDNLFQEWVDRTSASVEGGCNARVSVVTNGAPYHCGGSAHVTWIASDANGTSDSCSAVFTVPVSGEFSTDIPPDIIVESCFYTSREELQEVFNQWVESVQLTMEEKLEGGCDPVITNNAHSVFIPDICINWSAEVQFTIADKCDTVKINVGFNLTSPFGDCPRHFYTIWEGTKGYDQMNINVLNAQYNGVDLQPGDEIGVFDGDLCVGYGKVGQTINMENILTIIASRNDGTGNGFSSGNNISYVIWKCSESTEYPVKGIQYFDNQMNPIQPLTFTPGGTAFVELSSGSEICFELNFSSGWNLFSVPVHAEPSDMKAIFQPLIDNNSLVKIQDEQGNAVEDFGFIGGWKNFIGDIHPTEGYKIKANVDDSLKVYGEPVEYPFAIPLSSGWNIMGYPQTSSFDAMKIVQPLINNGTLQKVQDDVGSAIEDWGFLGGWKNFIGNFVPGEGYNIKLSEADTVWIQESYPKSAVAIPQLAATQYFNPEYEGNGVDHMNINIGSLPANILQPGDELAVFDGENCVGAVSLLPWHLNSSAVSIATSAADDFGMSGFIEGNAFTLRYWSGKQQQEYQLEPEILKGTSTFVKNESTLLSLEKYATAGTDGLLLSGQTEINCYPNPFSNKVTIEMNLAEDSEVQVEVLNQMGQHIHIVSKEVLLKNVNHKFSWNGKNSANQQVSSGIYYIRIVLEDEIFFKKVIYSKLE